MIGPKEAAKVAITAVADVFSPEDVHDVRLEEFDTDDKGDWLITVSYNAPAKLPPPVNAVAKALSSRSTTMTELFGPKWERSYKVVRVQRKSGKVLSIKIREGIGV